MYKNKGYYEVFSGGDHLEPGNRITIDHSITFMPMFSDLSELTKLPLETLQARRDGSAASEKVIFENLCGAAEAWEAQASQTMLLDKAIEYINTQAVAHTENKWQPDDYGHGQEISNMVYKMYHHVYEDTEYNRETKERVPVAWYLTWGVRTQAANGGRYTGSIAGQQRKRFTDKAAMEKYLQGRVKAYAHLFSEISPPIPKDFERYFSVNGQLLPGYRLEGQEPKLSERNAAASVPEKRESAIGKLAAAKDTVAHRDASKADAPREKPRGPEL